MAALPQLSLHEVPVPAHVTATMDQRECGHFLSASLIIGNVRTARADAVVC
jgi:hypothetical protein